MWLTKVIETIKTVKSKRKDRVLNTELRFILYGIVHYSTLCSSSVLLTKCGSAFRTYSFSNTKKMHYIIFVCTLLMYFVHYCYGTGLTICKVAKFCPRQSR